MYVTTPSGCLRCRTASAARPRSKSLPSASRRSPSAALGARLPRRARAAESSDRPLARRGRAPVVVEEADALDARQEARARRLVVEALEARALLVAELVADRVAQVGAEGRARSSPVRAACSSAMASRRARPRSFASKRSRSSSASSAPGAPAPRREDERQPRPLAATPRRGRRRARCCPSIVERRVADDDRAASCPRSPAIALAAWSPIHRGSLPFAEAAHDEPRERDARPRREIERDAPRAPRSGGPPRGRRSAPCPRAPIAHPRTRRRSPIVAAAAIGISATSASSSATRRATSLGSARSSATRAETGSRSSPS